MANNLNTIPEDGIQFGGEKVFSTWQNTDQTSVNFFLALKIVGYRITDAQVEIDLLANWTHQAYQNTIAFEWGYYYWYNETTGENGQGLVSEDPRFEWDGQIYDKIGTFTTPELLNEGHWTMSRTLVIPRDSSKQIVVVPFFKIGGSLFGSNSEPGWQNYYGVLLINNDSRNTGYSSNFTLTQNGQNYTIEAARVMAGLYENDQSGSSAARNYNYGFIVPSQKAAPNAPEITTITYPTADKPRELIINWTYGTYDSNNMPTMCQLWRKNSKSGENWTQTDNALALQTYELGTDPSTWPHDYTHVLDQNEKYKYMIRVWNEAGVIDSDPTNGWIYSQPAAPILKNVYSQGGSIWYETWDNNIRYKTDGAGEIVKEHYWRNKTANTGWMLSTSDNPMGKTNLTDVVEVKVISSFVQNGEKLESDDSNFTIVPNIVTPWINIDFSFETNKK